MCHTFDAHTYYVYHPRLSGKVPAREMNIAGSSTRRRTQLVGVTQEGKHAYRAETDEQQARRQAKTRRITQAPRCARPVNMTPCEYHTVFDHEMTGK
jgi:hypothetical protein